MTEEGAGVMLSCSALPRELQEWQAQSRDVLGNAGLRSYALLACYSFEIPYPERETQFIQFFTLAADLLGFCYTSGLKVSFRKAEKKSLRFMYFIVGQYNIYIAMGFHKGGIQPLFI